MFPWFIHFIPHWIFLFSVNWFRMANNEYSVIIYSTPCWWKVRLCVGVQKTFERKDVKRCYLHPWLWSCICTHFRGFLKLSSLNEGFSFKSGVGNFFANQSGISGLLSNLSYTRWALQAIFRFFLSIFVAIYVSGLGESIISALWTPPSFPRTWVRVCSDNIFMTVSLFGWRLILYCSLWQCISFSHLNVMSIKL